MVALALRTAAAAVREQDAALEVGAAESGLVVLGSSIGWFQFFGHAFFGARSTGFDLLCSDVQEAQRIAK
jgi:hypothetical protein